MENEKRLIDANALLEKEHWIIRSDGTRVFVIHAEDVDDAPTVDAVEVVHGRWIEEPFVWIDRMEAINRICSVCGWKNVLKNNYCPNCGAHMMDGGNEDV